MPEVAEDPPSLVVVEDERALADLYADWLSDSYDVVSVYTGEDAIDIIDDTIDIVLLDRRLPDISGDAVLEHVNEQYPSVQVAIVSAITPDFAILGLGIEDYLLKPVEQDDLQSLVAEMIERATYREPKQQLERLKASKNALEAELTQAELSQNREYQKLIREIEELQPRV